MFDSIVRVMTCGSVDDGKSTLIGRLMWETNSIYHDQIKSLKADSKKYGTMGSEIDFALLMDGLIAEREQGITIDVSYRYFQSQSRHFIIADCPGHTEYTKNMATAASKSSLAILLVDASLGLQIQTIRHAQIISMLGIKEILLAVNKMDKVDYNENILKKISQQFNERTQVNAFNIVHVIPVCAKDGDNLTQPSIKMPWYKGPTILDCLNKFNLTKKKETDFIFPVQIVNRSSSDFRGYSGTIAAGTISINDMIFAQHSHQKTKIQSIYRGFDQVKTAHTGESVTLVLQDNIDISRGSILTTSETKNIDNTSQFEARLFWMSENKGLKGRNFDIKLATQNSMATIININSKFDLEKLSWIAASELLHNDISSVDISVQSQLTISPFNENQELGSFILIDRMTNETVAAGVITHTLRRGQNISKQALTINRLQREKLNAHRSQVLWMTGLSGSGKSTIANALEVELFQRGYRTFILDGDNIRLGLNKDLGFTDADRVENIRRISEVAKLMMDAGLVVITSFISPFRNDREMARNLIGSENFSEIHISTPLQTCETRDPKGLYKKARAGLIPNFSGINSLYEEPLQPDIKIDTTNTKIEIAVQQILDKVFAK